MDEKKRLATLRSYGVLDTEREPEFDAIARRVAAVLKTPIALISLIDEDRQWFKASYGIDAFETPRSISFCTHAIRGPGVFVVEDAQLDDRFSSDPAVLGSRSLAGLTRVRFYAGMPLKARNGARIGTLCGVDTIVHGPLVPAQINDLKQLAEQTIGALEARKKRLRPAA